MKNDAAESNLVENPVEPLLRAPDYAELFKQIAAGDESALAALYDRTNTLVRIFADYAAGQSDG